ncbi:hypothetical protein EBZ39_10250 [bacterium]|nr:hypothetical protein [bacterium]
MTDHPAFLTKKSVDKLWWMCNRKFEAILPEINEKWDPSFTKKVGPKYYKKKKIEAWLSYLEATGIQVRRSRECFFRFEDVVVLSGFNPRRTYKIGIPYEMAERILVLGDLP